MRKKATLLIQHLEGIYTMTPKLTTCLSHGFLAIHHDRILALGEGDGSKHIDKDTRIMDGWGHIAIPALIDVAYAGSVKDPDMSGCYERAITLFKHGTMILNTDTPSKAELALFANHALPDLLDRPLDPRYTIIAPLSEQNKPQEPPFCISLNYPADNALDQLLCAKLYANRHPSIPHHQILAACTLYAAQALSLTDVGYLKAGARANVLLLQGATLSDIFTRFHGDETIHVIKDGVRRYPYLLI